MSDGHTLRGARRPGGEDHPAVVIGHGGAQLGTVEGTAIGAGFDGRPGGDDSGDGRLGEHGAGPLIGVVDVDGNVRRAEHERGQDRQVQFHRSRGNTDADLVTGADAGFCHVEREIADGDDELCVAEHPRAVVEGRLIGVGTGRLEEDVDEGAVLTGPYGGRELRCVFSHVSSGSLGS